MYECMHHVWAQAMLYNYMRLPLSHVTHESCWQMFIVHSSYVVLLPLAKPLLNH